MVSLVIVSHSARLAQGVAEMARAVGALSKVTEQCVACHAAYRAH